MIERADEVILESELKVNGINGIELKRKELIEIALKIGAGAIEAVAISSSDISVPITSKSLQEYSGK